MREGVETRRRPPVGTNGPWRRHSPGSPEMGTNRNPLVVGSSPTRPTTLATSRWPRFWTGELRKQTSLPQASPIETSRKEGGAVRRPLESKRSQIRSTLMSALVCDQGALALASRRQLTSRHKAQLLQMRRDGRITAAPQLQPQVAQARLASLLFELNVRSRDISGADSSSCHIDGPSLRT